MAAADEKCPAAAGFTGNVSDHGVATARGAALSIDAGDSFFAPTCETGVPAGTVTLTVQNKGQALHNISVPDQGIDQDITAGQTVTVQVKVGSAPLHFFCKYHRTSGMVGALLPGGN